MALWRSRKAKAEAERSEESGQVDPDTPDAFDVTADEATVDTAPRPAVDGDSSEAAADAAASGARDAEPGDADAADADGGVDLDTLLRPVARADRFTFQDLVAEATTDIGSRPGRLIMTIIGTVLGIGALVATIGFAQTTAAQIANRFDAVAATSVVVKPAEVKSGGDKTAATGRLPWDAPERVARLVGVENSVLTAEVPLAEGSEITAVPVTDPSAPQTTPPKLLATSDGLLTTNRGKIVTGRMFDEGHSERGDRVAVLGAGAAERLGVSRVESQPSIFISGIPYAVIGIVDEFQRDSTARDDVIIPIGTARKDFALAGAEQLTIRITVGSGPQVAEQARLALAPNAPDTLKATAPAARPDIAGDVQGDVNVVFLILGGIVLLAGALGIANVTLLTVTERVGEIGLRRALGATRRQISAQFMLESVVIGLLGGLIGSSLGVFSIVIVSLVQGWTPVVPIWAAMGGAVLGALVGWLAGWYPARRAASIEPVSALRSA